MPGQQTKLLLFSFLRKDFIYLFVRERGRKGERETSSCGCLSCAPYWGPGLQPKHAPWLGIELMTLSFACCLVHWATPARAKPNYFQWYCFNKIVADYQLCIFPILVEVCLLTFQQILNNIILWSFARTLHWLPFLVHILIIIFYWM